MKDPDLKILWMQCGQRCAICKAKLLEIKRDGKKYPVGEMAHIKGEASTAARYDSTMTKDECNGEPNRILLCPTCHTKIDKFPKDPTHFPIEELLKIKENHITWVEDQLRLSIANITFAELEVILKYLITTPTRNLDLTVIPSQDKIKKNQLSEKVDEYIKMGLMQSKQVAEYINKNPDPDFGDKLRNGFITQYQELKRKGLTGIEIFYELQQFSSNYSTDFDKQAAGLSVLSYFFELCDIFEKE